MISSIVLVKQVPDTANITGNVMQEDGTVNRAKLPAVLNHEDRVALELALQVKDQYGGAVAAVSMGPPRASDILRECLYMGADSAYLVTDRKFAGADTLATSYVLSEAIKKIGNFDFVFAGRQAIDGDTAQVGPQTAELLNIPQITYAQKINVEGNKVKVERQMEEGYEILESSLPCLITCISEINEMEYTSLNGIKQAYRNKKVRVLSADDVKADKLRIGLLSSPTSVKKSFTPPAKGQGQILRGATKELAKKVVSILKEKEL